MITRASTAKDQIVELSDALTRYMQQPFSQTERLYKFQRPLDSLKSEGLRVAVEDEDIAIVSKNLLDPAFGGQPANPSRDEIIKRLEAIFVDGEPYIKLQTNLEKYLRHYDYIALVGERGSGKTLFLNKWLNEQTRTFFENDINSAWFRVDATKIYNLLSRSGVDPKNVSIEAYYVIHTAYVILEYSGLLINPLSKKHNISPFLEDVMKYRDALVESERALFEESLSKIGKYYQTMIGDPNAEEYPSEEAVARAFLTDNEVIFRSFSNVFRNSMAFFRAIQFGIIAIVDGIDNVSWSHGNYKYLKVCKDARSFAQRFKSICRNNSAKIIYVLRPETVAELDMKITGYNTGQGQAGAPNIVFEPLKVPIGDPQEIINRKLYAANYSIVFNDQRQYCLSFFSDKDQKNDTSNRFSSIMNAYSDQSSSFVDTLVEQINQIIHQVRNPYLNFYLSKIESKNFLRDLFNDNVRATIHAFRRSKEGKINQEDAEVVNADSPSRLPQYLLCGGRLFINSSTSSTREDRFSQIPVGEVFPNIFWYDQRRAVSKSNLWHGLSGLRLLQFAAFRTLPACDVLAILAGLFKYEPLILSEQLEAFVAFGLIEVDLSKPISGIQYVPVDPHTKKSISSYKNLIKTTRKGRLLATLSLVYFNWMYYACLDTPLLECFGPTESSSHVRFYLDPETADRIYQFYDASLPTVATLCRHISYFHREEIVGLRSGVGKDVFYSWLDVSRDNLAKIFELPVDWEAIVATAFKVALRRRQRPQRDRSGFEELSNLIMGTLDPLRRSHQ